MLGVAFVVGVAVVAALAVAVGPLYAADRFRDLREPTDAERAQIVALAEPGGLAVERVAIEAVDGAGGDGAAADGPAEVSVRGPPRRRVLFLTEDVLTDLDEDTAVGLFAAEAGRVTTYYAEFRAVAVGAVLGALAAVVTTLVPFESGFAALVAVGLVSFWAGRRVQYAADARAADAVGADRVADAFERVAERRGVEPETGDWSTWFEVQPPLGDRVARLRERAADAE
ncbi:peptidase [Halorubrum ezzemoulense]|jgi:Zn-dependent protease with chaperone function|uniref:peptidase n=1 Tax=Halorubrum ezzemoulense TaxID=337243 RepID=UPI00232A8C49|nr:peptidase [Halorubrum ezzemoulense]MDB2238436.1 peptidase [Halorubrum ezzemoulense]MDB2247906.1 peptidase [Halorubrum ezzemoulense]MDB2260602.1 peptidase [Halorubrum ezzemoulense]MDB2264975.1 peptidase [Halorubrum ezzemoulense]MDB2267005.1 peptidase [Halorubrum ezzemoulense]